MGKVQQRHTSQGGPEGAKEQHGLDPNLNPATTRFVQLAQPRHHALSQRRVESRVPRVVGGIVSDSLADAPRVVRLKQDGRVGARGQSDDITARVLGEELGDVVDLMRKHT